MFHRPTIRSNFLISRVLATLSTEVAGAATYAAAVSAQMRLSNAGRVFEAIDREVDGKKIIVGSRRLIDRSKYAVHQGKQEKARRVLQMQGTRHETPIA